MSAPIRSMEDLVDAVRLAKVRALGALAAERGQPLAQMALAWVLRDRGPTLRFEEIAGLVEVEIAGDIATIAAPQPLSLGAEMPAELLAGKSMSQADCAALASADGAAMCGR